MNIVRNVSVVTRSLALVLLVGTLNSQAATLSSTTPVSVPLSSEGIPAYVYPDLSASSGTWATTTAAAAWVGIGSYSISGPGTGNVTTGTTTYGFTGGALPIATYFIFNDVDGGSGAGETITLKAYDSLGLIITPWLNGTAGTWGIGSTSLAAMPSYSWNSTTGTYLFDGAGETYPSNPSLSFALLSNTAITQLVVVKATTNNAFTLAAPTAVPLPAAGWLFMTGLLGLAGLGRTRRNR